MRIGLVSLGCAKNQVNSEQMLFLLKEAGHDIASGFEDIDVAVINTCGFIESAKAEAIDNILELARLKEEGKLDKIVVAGCLAQRYQEELAKELPEVDGIVGCGSYSDIVQAVEKAAFGEKPMLLGDIDSTQEDIGRVLSTPAHFAYLKIAEGCDNRCSYCVIPSLRGKYRSRDIESLVAEAKELAANGVKELILVAQDSSRYGLDIYGERRLSELLERLCAIDELEWIRVHYLYPDEIDDRLIELIAREDKIVKYLDIPIQHCNDELLAAMNRRGDKEHLDALLEKLRDKIPGVVLRTSIICGLPGEDDEKFEELCDFLKRHKLERAGVFAYSAEEGTAAAEMEGQVDSELAQRRVSLLVDLQSRVMDEYNESLMGKTLRVLCEGYDEDSQSYFGRSFADSPEVDGRVLFSSESPVEAGSFVSVRISAALDGDLTGQVV